mgnify:CR=1 FL=1
MDHSLREGDVDAFAVEEFVDLLLAFVVHGPIVGGLHPHADGEVHAAVGERDHVNAGRLVGSLVQNLLTRTGFIDERRADARHDFSLAAPDRQPQAAQYVHPTV